MTLTSSRPVVVPDEPRDRLGLLLARVARGDHEAFAALYDATAPTVFGLALNVVGDEGLACEVARRTYAEVWRDAPAWSRAQGSAAAWIVATGTTGGIEAALWGVIAFYALLIATTWFAYARSSTTHGAGTV